MSIKGWNPSETRDFLTHKGYSTREYKDYMGDGYYYCLSDMRPLHKTMAHKLANDLAYYAEGVRHKVTRLKLHLNINDMPHQKQSLAILSDIADALTTKAINSPLTAEIKIAVIAGTAGEWDLDGAKIKFLKRNKVADEGLNYLYTIEKL